mgnify:CR=1 FL=1
MDLSVLFTMSTPFPALAQRSPAVNGTYKERRIWSVSDPAQSMKGGGVQAYSTKAKSSLITSPSKEVWVRSTTSLARTLAREERRVNVAIEESLMVWVGKVGEG